MPSALTNIEVDMTEKHKSKKLKKEKKHSKKSKKEKCNGEASDEVHKILNGITSGNENENSVIKKTKKPKKTDEEKRSKKESKEKTSTDDEAVAKCNGEVQVSEAEIKGAFSNFEMLDSVKNKLIAKGIKFLFPIQVATYNLIYEGHDVLAQARTGTGKTYAFALPIVCKLQNDTQTLDNRRRSPRVLVLTPTRELAKQVSDDFSSVSTKLKIFCIYGGVPYGPQIVALKSGLDVLVGTPGRILDYVKRGALDTSQLSHVILDEVDQMLDMGFADDVDNIIQAAYNHENKSSNPQTLLFSATLPPWVNNTAAKYMRDDVKRVDMIGRDRVKTATTVQHYAIRCGYRDRAAAIGDVIKVYSGSHGRSMVFCETKKEADELACCKDIQQEAHVLHGDIKQNTREIVLKKFREGSIRCLVTTNVAARGLDIPEVDLVIQCEPPQDVDFYIHRSGRTGRAGRSGISVCFYKPREEHALTLVEKKSGISFTRIPVPSLDSLVTAASDDAVKSLASVPISTLTHFYAAAEKLIEEKGATNVMAAALAILSGNQTIMSRSLLNATKGFTTWQFEASITMYGASYCWRALQQQIPENMKESIIGMTLCMDKTKCVFDLPSKFDDEIEKLWSDNAHHYLKKATEIPQLVPQTSSYPQRYGGNYGRSFQNGCFKRKFDIAGKSAPNKRIKF